MHRLVVTLTAALTLTLTSTMVGCSGDESESTCIGSATTPQQEQSQGEGMVDPSRDLMDVVRSSSVVVSGSVQQSTVDCEVTVLDIKVTEQLKGEPALPGGEVISVEVASIRYTGRDGEGLWFLEPANESSTAGVNFVEVDNYNSVPEEMRSRRSVIRVVAGMTTSESRPGDDVVRSLYDRADIVVQVSVVAADDYKSAQITYVNEVLKGNVPLGPIDGPIVRPPPSDLPGGTWEFEVDGSGMLFIRGTFDDPSVMNWFHFSYVTARKLKELIS